MQRNRNHLHMNNMPEKIETPAKTPEPLYPCNCCREEYTWPADCLFWCANIGDWHCWENWDADEHGERGICLADHLTNALNETRAKLAEVESRVDWLEGQREIALKERDNAIEVQADLIDERDSIRRELITEISKLADSKAREGRLSEALKSSKSVTEWLLGIHEQIPETPDGTPAWIVLDRMHGAQLFALADAPGKEDK